MFPACRSKFAMKVLRKSPTAPRNFRPKQNIMEICLHLVYVLLVLSSTVDAAHGTEVTCSDGDVRLEGGRDEFEGRVEMCDEGEWKSVCDLRWGREEAEVVCRELGYMENSNPIFTRRSCIGPGSGEIINTEWKCSGTEGRLQGCNMIQPNRTCDNRTEAGVYCSGVTADDCTRESVRLVNGSNNGSGRVEICRCGCWGTVCDERWDSNDAAVVCRQLGIDTERAIPTRGAYFGEGSGPIHLTEVECVNNELRLISCSSLRDGINDCVHSQDAGVICKGPSSCRDGDIQLTGGEKKGEGQVEVCYNGVWGTVCANGWDETGERLVCTQLGYQHRGQDINVTIEQENSNTPILFGSVDCSSSHTNLSQCFDLQYVGIGIHNCQQTGVAAVSCEGIPDNINPTLTVTMITDPILHETTANVSIVVKFNSNPDAIPKDSSKVQLPAVLGSVLCSLLLVLALVVTIVVTMALFKRKKCNHRNCSASDIDDINNREDIGLQENAAYAQHSFKTVKNEAYETCVSNPQEHIYATIADINNCEDVGLKENVAYAQHDIKTVKNGAYEVVPHPQEHTYATITSD